MSCGLIHPEVEASGMWYCPNALCKGVGGAWFRATLDSYVECKKTHTHTIDEDEWQKKGKAYNKKHNIYRQELVRKNNEDYGSK